MEQIFTDVPEAEVPQVEQGCRDAGATEVKKEKQPDGSFTVTCTYPDPGA
jgi:hypothetical protein